MTIYTKTGDKGETGLFSKNLSKPRRISKDSLRISAIGNIDELNSYLGICISLCRSKTVRSKLQEIQKNLFTIGSILAGSSLKFDAKETKDLEKEIDKIQSKIPVLKNFILPGGGSLGANLHYIRTITRRAERALVALSKKEKVPDEILQFINRLSDYFFILARFVNAKSKQKEIPWKA